MNARKLKRAHCRRAALARQYLQFKEALAGVRLFAEYSDRLGRAFRLLSTSAEMVRLDLVDELSSQPCATAQRASEIAACAMARAAQH